MSTRQIASSTLWQFASQITMAALSIVTVKIVAVGLSKELAGNYNSAYGFLQIFGILADFGLYAVAVREVSAAKERKELLGTFLTLRMIILALSLGTALLFAWVFPAWRGTPLPPGITVAAFVPFFTLLAGVLRAVFQTNYKMHFVFIAEVTQRVVTVALMAWLLLWSGARESADASMYFGFLGAGAAGAAVLFLLTVIFASRFAVIRPHWDSALLRGLFLRALPYGIAFLCTALYRQSDITLIAALRPDYELQNAYYGFVQRALDMGYLLPTFLLNSTLPLLAARHAKGEDTRMLLGKTLFLILLLSSTMFLFAFLWPRPLMHLLTTESYLSTATEPGSDTALRLLSFSMLLNGLVLYAFYALLARHRWKPLVIVLALGAALSLVLNVILIPRFGFIGSSVTSIVTHLFLAAVLLPVSLRSFPAAFTLDLWLRWIAYTVMLGLFLFLLMPFLRTVEATIIGLAAALAIIVGASWMTGVHRKMGL